AHPVWHVALAMNPETGWFPTRLFLPGPRTFSSPHHTTVSPSIYSMAPQMPKGRPKAARFAPRRYARAGLREPEPHYPGPGSARHREPVWWRATTYLWRNRATQARPPTTHAPPHPALYPSR